MLDHTQTQVAEASVDSARTDDLGMLSPAIQRLMQEVRNKDVVQASGGKYDRTHNRHNRGQ